MLRCATAWPRSYRAKCCSLPSAVTTSARATMSTAADPAHTLLKLIRFSTIEANAGVPRRATMNRHGCELLADGDQRAASRAAVSLVSSTDEVGSNERGLQRS